MNPVRLLRVLAALVPLVALGWLSPPASAQTLQEVVDDPSMHALNRRYLEHDYPTDVLSFVLDQDEDRLEGQLVVSADTAAASAEQYGWSAADELLLYVIHGSLHLVGCDDRQMEQRREMRELEQRYLKLHGLQPRYEAESAGGETK